MTTPTPNPNDHFDLKAPTSDRGSVRITKLLDDGANWILYKEELTSAVGAKGLRRYLMGTEKQPVAPTAQGVDEEADEKYEIAKDNWQSKHDTIKSLLYQSLPETLKLKISNLTQKSETGQRSFARISESQKAIGQNVRKPEDARCQRLSDIRSPGSQEAHTK
ncbi:hypothetical protein NLI96_g7549 [Meripilus lineatus]|uniref:Uncharacterized protein n=1 Tax=Meripilus lineatus TaxID=2056292 RepID=A0AAD5UZ87_9APHY|nr:hypothetical protein NLI96_g7549 [Physisporinus lineatus]